MSTSPQYRVLVITDHRNHQPEESLYPLLRSMRTNGLCQSIHVASRVNPANTDFFERMATDRVWAGKVDPFFSYPMRHRYLIEHCRELSVRDVDVILLRLPKPNPPDFFSFLSSLVEESRIINRPSSILETGSKAYLLNFPELCPPMRLCQSVQDVLSFREQFPIVLKPFSDAGGRGLLKIEGDTVWEGQRSLPLEDFLPEIDRQIAAGKGYLAMQYLNNVSMGDKRLIMVNGQITGSALRLPAQDSWLCNVNMGGSAVAAAPDSREKEIAAVLGPALKEKGIILFGFDTLIDNQGRSVLSEINASNAGGLYPAQLLSGEPVIQRSSDLLWQYIGEHIPVLA